MLALEIELESRRFESRSSFGALKSEVEFELKGSEKFFAHNAPDVWKDAKEKRTKVTSKVIQKVNQK